MYTTQALNKEIAALQKLGNSGQTLLQTLEARRDQIATEEGQRIKNKATWKITQIEGMLQNLQITKLDISDLEERMLKQIAMTGKKPTPKREAKRKIRAERDHNVWPYDGEEWADEIGYYNIKVQSECPASF